MAVAVDGDLAGVSSEIDRILSSDDVSAKEVSDAAVALAYLQAKADRRCIGEGSMRGAAWHHATRYSIQACHHTCLTTHAPLFAGCGARFSSAQLRSRRLSMPPA